MANIRPISDIGIRIRMDHNSYIPISLVFYDSFSPFHWSSASPLVFVVQRSSSELWVCGATADGLLEDGVLRLPLVVLLSSPAWSSSFSNASCSSSSDATPSPLTPPKPPPPLMLSVHLRLAAADCRVSMVYLWPSTQLHTAFTEPKHWPSSTSFRLGQERQASPWWWAQDTRLWRHLGSEVKHGGAETKQENHGMEWCVLIEISMEENVSVKQGLLVEQLFCEESGQFGASLKERKYFN